MPVIYFLFSDKDRKAISDTVRQTLNNYYADIKKDGLFAEFRYLDISSEFFWVPPGYPSSLSYDSISSILKKNAPLYKSINNTWETLKVNSLTPELTNYTGTTKSIMTDSSGKVFELRLIETGLIIKRKDGWKLLNGQTSIISNK